MDEHRKPVNTAELIDAIDRLFEKTTQMSPLNKLYQTKMEAVISGLIKVVKRLEQGVRDGA